MATWISGHIDHHTDMSNCFGIDEFDYWIFEHRVQWETINKALVYYLSRSLMSNAGSQYKIANSFVLLASVYWKNNYFEFTCILTSSKDWRLNDVKLRWNCGKLLPPLKLDSMKTASKLEVSYRSIQDGKHLKLAHAIWARKIKVVYLKCSCLELTDPLGRFQLFLRLWWLFNVFDICESWPITALSQTEKYMIHIICCLK